MESSELTATLVQVATLYYEDNESQQEIADQFGVSRSLIALYLKHAREQNIVRIQIVNPQDQCEDLALALQDKTGCGASTSFPTPVPTSWSCGPWAAQWRAFWRVACTMGI